MRDADALPLLLDVMAEAGHHDGEACLLLLDAVEGTLGAGPHKARVEVAAAREGVAAGDWVRVHSAAWGAMCGLTWAFPPAPTSCPPVPRETPFPRVPVVCACGVTPHVGASFCHGCGQSV